MREAFGIEVLGEKKKKRNRLLKRKSLQNKGKVFPDAVWGKH